MKTANISKGTSYNTQTEHNAKRHLTNAVSTKMHLALVESCTSDWTNL